MEVKKFIKTIVRNSATFDRMRVLKEWYRINIHTSIIPLPSETWQEPIFIHIPKAAGSSILRMPVYSTKGHKSLRYYEKRLPRGKKMPITFAVVRDPYTRLASAFYYLKKFTNKPYDKNWARKNILQYSDLNDFVLNALHRKSVLKWMHFKPQETFVSTQKGTIGVDYILRFERLRSDWSSFAEITGIPHHLPVTNVTGSGKKVDELNDKSRSKIYSLYQNDFELFGYPK